MSDAELRQSRVERGRLTGQSLPTRITFVSLPPRGSGRRDKRKNPVNFHPRSRLRRSVLILLACLGTAVPAAAAENPLRVVGVLGNTSGMSDRPLPYAFYSGIAVDGRGRLFLGGAPQGIVVCDQDGQ